ncbi:hypothetical protein KFL_004360090 [Klebsormidium nitens]|uniref:Cilia-and flagella-associated protein 96 n=1 Tax=Klebsormidium nitens TaxID=105231 RepID=A0A1Y1IIQ1_KLENI|nr:hypothetical protein KFL_004360090 [Klebsormidium nitens]|eukprot:GAQ88527.1 hypothetical protein KFL_004360090 [Klebsormidium nitens]
MTNKYGHFSEEYITLGDENHQKHEPDPRISGKNFSTTITRSGKLADATFDKIKPLCETVPYEDLSKSRRERLAASQKLNLSEKPFKRNSGRKTGVGTSSWDGCFGPKLAYEPEQPTVKKGAGAVKTAPRNFFTSPPKKGTFGCIGVTLSERAKVGGVVGEYAYVPNEYVDRGSLKKKPGEAEAPDLKPFYPARVGKWKGAAYPKSVMGNEYEHIELGPAPVTKAETGLAPFKPAKSSKDPLGKYPEYLPDPETEKWNKQREERLKSKELMTKPFIPSRGPKTKATASILRMNVVG